MIIAKQFYFDSSHQLPDEDCYGKCRNLHGHTYKLIIEIKGEVNNKGWVLNFKDLKELVNKKVIDILDHNHINYIVPLSTAENILIWIREQLHDDIWKLGATLHSLTLWETPTSYAKLEG